MWLLHKVQYEFQYWVVIELEKVKIRLQCNGQIAIHLQCIYYSVIAQLKTNLYSGINIVKCYFDVNIVSFF